MPLDLAETLAQLVALPSVNPMGRPANGPEFYEYRVTEYLERLFSRHGIASHRQAIAPLRENLIARVDGCPAPEAGGALLLFEVHQDTVPVDGMTIEPWNPVIRDRPPLWARLMRCQRRHGGHARSIGPVGRDTQIEVGNVSHRDNGLHGERREWFHRGDGLVPILVRSRFSTNSPPARRRPRGRTDQPRHRRGPQGCCPLAMPYAWSRGPQFAAGARGQCNLPDGRGGGRPGAIRLRSVANPSGASTVRPPDIERGDNRRRHGRESRAPAGDNRNRSTAGTGEQPAQAYQQAIAYVANAVGPAGAAHIEHEPPFIQNAGLSDANNVWLAARLGSTISAVGGSARTSGVSFGTDAAALSLSGVPSVVFGPGSINQAHTADEWLPLDELQTASEILFRFASRPLEPTTG